MSSLVLDQLTRSDRQRLLQLARARGLKPKESMRAITAAPRDGVLPPSVAQERLWFLSQMGGVSEAYHIAAGLRLRGELDRSALRRALDRIVARHEGLRTRFVRVDGEPVQEIGEEGEGF